MLVCGMLLLDDICCMTVHTYVRIAVVHYDILGPNRDQLNVFNVTRKKSDDVKWVHTAG